ncbi:hypothetical protein FRC09_014221 [Ceratobasidium sp. 395]|nr:hypothetical protein FRC09_014221 [Ceratobasidium sp. 395]
MSALSKLVGEGSTLIETIKRSSAEVNLNNPLDKYTINDGFYRMTQIDNNGNLVEASFDATVPSYHDNGYQLGMNGSPQAKTQIWKFTSQWGIKYGFTIVPKDGPGASKDGYGAAVCRGDQQHVEIERLGSYTVWKVRCDEEHVYRRKDGSTKTLYYFRIESPGRNEQVWRTEYWNPGSPVNVNQATWDPILPNELFLMIPDEPVN